ncbi:MAG: hypothetical protein ACFFA6_03560 [Promethearchaeota archaeon]
MSLWRIIARNEIRLKTYRFRKNRKLFFILIYSLFLLWAAYIGPILFDAILPEILKNYTETYESIITLVFEYSLMMVFVMYAIYPLFILYRRKEIGIKDIILASPIKAGDIYIGEFIGQLPFYFLFLLGIGPLGTSLSAQVNPKLGFLEYLVFYSSIFMLLIFALLIGTILANLFENKIETSKKAQELGNWLLVFLSFIVISIFYLFHFLFEFVSNYPEFKSWLVFFPSFWYSNIILYLINPLLVEPYILDIWLMVSLAIIVPLLIFYISYKKAYVFYSLERVIEKKSITVREENRFYKLLRRFTPNKWSGLIVAQFKQFLRKKENYAKLIYSLVFTGFIGFFISFSLKDSVLTIEDNPLEFPLIIEILNHKLLMVLIIGWIGGLVFGILIGISIFADSKEILFIYKKSPRGINSLIYAYLFQMLYILGFFDLLLTVFFIFILELNFFIAFTFFIVFIVNTGIILLEAISVQCFKPLFEERGKDVFLNIYLIVIFQIISLLITLLILIPNFSPFINVSVGLLFILLVNIGVSTALSWALFYTGIQKLNKIE